MKLKNNADTGDRRNYATEERVGSLFQPDTLLAEDYFSNFRRKTPLEVEKTLMLAVLEDGIRCFQENLFAPSGKKRVLFEEAQDWLYDDDADGLFAFITICSLLGLDPGYVRRGLTQWQERERQAAPIKETGGAIVEQRLVA